MTNSNETYCGDRFTIDTNIESLCCAPETNTMFYVNYTSVKKDTITPEIPSPTTASSGKHRSDFSTKVSFWLS